LTHGAAQVCYAKGWEREHEGGECLCRRRAPHCVGCARLSASGLAQPVAEGDSPSAEGAEGHEVKGNAVCCNNVTSALLTAPVIWIRWHVVVVDLLPEDRSLERVGNAGS